jgi:hypothetical protein
MHGTSLSKKPIHSHLISLEITLADLSRVSGSVHSSKETHPDVNDDGGEITLEREHDGELFFIFFRLNKRDKNFFRSSHTQIPLRCHSKQAREEKGGNLRINCHQLCSLTSREIFFTIQQILSFGGGGRREDFKLNGGDNRWLLIKREKFFRF